MNLMQTLPRISGLTVTEAETLAAMFASATRHMSNATDRDGRFIWSVGIGDACEDIFLGFYEITHGAINAGGTTELYTVSI